jgi:hypothetical protein
MASLIGVLVLFCLVFILCHHHTDSQPTILHTIVGSFQSYVARGSKTVNVTEIAEVKPSVKMLKLLVNNTKLHPWDQCTHQSTTLKIKACWLTLTPLRAFIMGFSSICDGPYLPILLVSIDLFAPCLDPLHGLVTPKIG